MFNNREPSEAPNSISGPWPNFGTGITAYIQSLPHSRLATEFREVERCFVEAIGDDPEMKPLLAQEVYQGQRAAAAVIISELMQAMRDAREKSPSHQSLLARPDIVYIELQDDVRYLQSLANDFRESPDLRDHPALQSTLADELTEVFHRLRVLSDPDMPSDPGAERLTCRQFVASLDDIASYAIRHIKHEEADDTQLSPIPIQATRSTSSNPKGKPKRKAGPGRWQEYDPDKDAKLVEDWKASGQQKKEFEQARGLASGAVRIAQDRIRNTRNK